MKTLIVELGDRSYPIHIGAGLLHNSDLIADCVAGLQLVIVSDENVAPLYLETVKKGLSGFEIANCILPAGEATKNLDQARRVIDALAENGCHRDATVLALGGGVVGDMAGFAAACYQRGIGYMQLPTTLLAQVDASVGGKTAVNHRRGKNLIGAFHQPRAVITDTNTLNSLPDREFNAGLAEVIKHALITDSDFFEWLEKHIEDLARREPDALVHAISECCAIKARIVAADEREQGNRVLLNFGHTFAHGIEAATGYTQWLHGEAVAAGMLMAAEVSRICVQGGGQMGDEEVGRIRALLERAKLPVRVEGVDSGALRHAMSMDKKIRDGKLRLVLLEAIGHAYLDDNTNPELMDGHLDTVLREYTL